MAITPAKENLRVALQGWTAVVMYKSERGAISNGNVLWH